jgi:hypothetical protein
MQRMATKTPVMTCKSLIAVPLSLLGRADEVIE